VNGVQDDGASAGGGLTTREATDGSRHNASTPDGAAERCEPRGGSG